MRRRLAEQQRQLEKAELLEKKEEVPEKRPVLHVKGKNGNLRRTTNQHS